MRTVCLFVLLCVSALSYGAKKYKLVEISTNLGNIKIRLYENTPRHSENFLKLVKAHHYDSLLFHRVIGDFMIQGGSSDSRHAPKETDTKTGLSIFMTVRDIPSRPRFVRSIVISKVLWLLHVRETRSIRRKDRRGNSFIWFRGRHIRIRSWTR